MIFNTTKATIALGAAIGVGVAHAAPKQQPNVLFIVVDDLNDWISPLAGHPNMVTPNLDRLRQRSVVFTNAYCQTPLSGPSRASFLSGLYPSTSGVYFQITDDKLKACSEPIGATQFLPEYFSNNGYKTMGAGKVFHSGDKAKVFQHYAGPWGIYGPVPEKRFKYNPAWFGKPKGTQTDWGVYPQSEEEMPDYKTTEWCVERLGEKHDKPFFLAAGLVRPHVPWYVPQKWFDMISSDMATYPAYNPFDYDDIPTIARRMSELPMMPDMDWVLKNGYWKEIIQAYMACVAFMDWNVGRILDALDKSPYRDNTIIVFMGDNGYELGEKGRFSKHALWRTSVHVPLMIAMPKGVKNQYCDAGVGLIDIYPTLTELCALPANPKNQGRSIAPLLKDPSQKWDYPANTFFGAKNQSVYWDKYHFIKYSDGSCELYDLRSDPEEWYNKAGQQQYADIEAKMNSMLIANPVPNIPESVINVNHYFLNKEYE